MTLRDNTIHKLQNLPESLLPKVNDLIDCLSDMHQVDSSSNDSKQNEITEKWEQWFEIVDNLPIKPTDSADDYQQHLLSKYRKQGLDL